MTFPAHPFFIALQFLTTVPVHLKDLPGEKAMGRSLLYYPLVGAIIGAALCAFLWAMTLAGPSTEPLIAAILLTLWVLLTGGLHLDGLADSVDALMGGFGDRQRTLEIMKDPTSGPMGILALILVLLIKFTALWALVGAHNWQALVIAPLMGRTAVIMLFLTTPYVRQNGLGTIIANSVSQRSGWWMIMLVMFVCLLIGGSVILWLYLAIPALFLIQRGVMMQRLGGTTGDTAGAVVELTELLVLVVTAFYASS